MSGKALVVKLIELYKTQLRVKSIGSPLGPRSAVVAAVSIDRRESRECVAGAVDETAEDGAER